MDAQQFMPRPLEVAGDARIQFRLIGRAEHDPLQTQRGERLAHRPGERRGPGARRALGQFGAGFGLPHRDRAGGAGIADHVEPIVGQDARGGALKARPGRSQTLAGYLTRHRDT